MWLERPRQSTAPRSRRHDDRAVEARQRARGTTAPASWSTRDQAASLLVAVTYVGMRGRGKRLMAFFACMYYAAMRPAEVTGLRSQDCWLPAAGWGKMDGRIFRSERGKPVASTAYTQVWQDARLLAFAPEQVASPLAGRPYDLRHAAVSLWLNGGVSPTEIAKRAGHSVEVLLRVYAKCVSGQEEIANHRIEEILGPVPDNAVDDMAA